MNETGSIIEKELFGKIENRGRIEKADKFEYLKYAEAMQLARKMQPADPKDPKNDFAYEVFIRIEKLLDAEGKLNFFTAVGSQLDMFHGVDGWFETDDGRRVTIDLTVNPNKANYKADLVYYVPGTGLDRQVNGEEFDQYAGNLASEVAARL